MSSYRHSIACSGLHPRRRLNEWLQRLDDLRGELSRCARSGTRERQVAWRNLCDRFSRLSSSP